MDNQKQNAPEERAVVCTSLIAVDRYVETNIVSNEESISRGRDFVNWGPLNNFPEYLHKLYKTVTTLRSVIGGCVNYVAGDRVDGRALMADGKMNRKGDTLRTIVRKAAKDYELYGGFAFNAIRNNEGKVVEIYNVDMRYLRSNEENTVFYYSEDWGKRWGKAKDVISPKFVRDLDWSKLEDDARKAMLTSIAYFKGEDSDGDTYPSCLFEAAIKDCEIERMIEEFHLNDLNNGFAASYVLNILSGGTPPDDVKEKVEKDVKEKLGGYQNGGRIMLNFAVDKDHMAVAQKLEASNFEERYKALAARARQQIYAAFHANPNLFGIPTENLGFSSEEYESAFKLFNRTMITPVQIMIAEALQSIYDCNLKITPFSLEGNSENANTATGGASE